MQGNPSDNLGTGQGGTSGARWAKQRTGKRGKSGQQRTLANQMMGIDMLDGMKDDLPIAGRAAEALGELESSINSGGPRI
jgi:hypothetical protein